MGQQPDSRPTPTNNLDTGGCLLRPMLHRKCVLRSSNDTFPDCVLPCCMRHRQDPADHDTKGMDGPASPRQGGKHRHMSSKLLRKRGVREVSSDRALPVQRPHPTRLASVGPSEHYRRQGRPHRSPIACLLRLPRANAGREQLLAVVALPLHMAREPSGSPARGQYLEEMLTNAAGHEWAGGSMHVDQAETQPPRRDGLDRLGRCWRGGATPKGEPGTHSEHIAGLAKAAEQTGWPVAPCAWTARGCKVQIGEPSIAGGWRTAPVLDLPAPPTLQGTGGK